MRDGVICLMGPTACGKTWLGIELARRLGGEIISTDSALIYRGMDIGTAKPTAAERQGIPHHLIDILDPADSYSAADFRQDALSLISQIRSRGRLPILVGGTMLYFRALLEGISSLPPSDPAVREELQQCLEQQGLEALHRRLQQEDPVSAARIRPQDTQRILRALEIRIISGRTMTELLSADPGSGPGFPALQLALLPRDREALRQRIGQRFDRMLADGFEAEVARLRQRGDLSLDLPSMRCVGYRQCWQYLDGLLDRQEMIYRSKVATCQLAKRQITWIRGWKLPCSLLDPGEDPEALLQQSLDLAASFLEGEAVSPD